jgi:Na+/phosphate symporter
LKASRNACNLVSLDLTCNLFPDIICSTSLSGIVKSNVFSTFLGLGLGLGFALTFFFGSSIGTFGLTASIITSFWELIKSLILLILA